MVFWVYMTGMALLLPLSMVIFGTWFMRRPPKKISVNFGYRTARSMKNKDTWDFAHRHIGRLWRGWGWATMAVSLLIMYLVRHGGQATVGYVGLFLVCVQLIPFIGSILSTERALQRTFDRSGQRIE